MAKTKKTCPIPLTEKRNPTDKSILERLVFLGNLQREHNKTNDSMIRCYQEITSPFKYDLDPTRKFPNTDWGSRQSWVPRVAHNLGATPPAPIAKQFRKIPDKGYLLLLECGPQDIRVRVRGETSLKVVEMDRFPYDAKLISETIAKWKKLKPPVPSPSVLEVRELACYQLMAKILANNAHLIFRIGHLGFLINGEDWSAFELLLRGNAPLSAVRVHFDQDKMRVMEYRKGELEIAGFDYADPVNTLEAFLREYLGLTIPDEPPEYLPNLPPDYDELGE